MLLLLFIYVAVMILTAIRASPPGAPKTKLILKSKDRDPFAIDEMHFYEMQLHMCAKGVSEW